MIKLIVKNKMTEVIGGIPEDLKKSLLTIPNTVWSKIDPKTGRYLRKAIPITQYITFLDVDANGRQFIPSGISGAVGDWYEENGFTIDFKDDRSFVGEKVSFNWDSDVELRDYQVITVNSCVEKTRGIFVVPTGGGKTMIAKRLIYLLHRKTLYLVPSSELRTQAVSELSTLTDSVGMLKSPYNTYDITVSTVSMLWSLFKKDEVLFNSVIGQFDLLIGDEVHHINALKKKRGSRTGGTWIDVFNKIPAYYKFGCTATPGGDGSFNRLSMSIAVGRVLHTSTMKQLKDAGYLSDIEVHFYNVVVKNESYSWLEAQNNLIGSVDFNTAVVELARKYNSQGNSVVIMVDLIKKHAMVLAEMLPEAFVVHGGTSSEDRAYVIQKLRNNEKIIVISSVYKEGVDIPALDVGVLIGGVGEKIITQKVGRLTRLFKNKQKGILIDFNHLDGRDIVGKRGGMIRKKHLLEIHSDKRKITYKKLGFKIIEFDSYN